MTCFSMAKGWVPIFVVFSVSVILVQPLPTGSIQGNQYVEIDRSFRDELARHSIYSSVAYCAKLSEDKCWPDDRVELGPIDFDTCCPQKPADLVVTSHFKSTLHGLYGYIGYSNLHKEVVFAFKGTDADMSVLTDVLRLQVEYPYPELPESWLKELKLVRETLIIGGVEVHSGFLLAFKKVQSVAFRRLEELALKLGSEGNDYKLIIAGHSMGGAVATIAAMELKRLYINPKLNSELPSVKSLIPRSNIFLHTYGAPRSGSKDFAYLVYNTFKDSSPSVNIARVTNYKDPVVGSNPKKLNSMHNPKEIYLNEKGLAVYCHDVNGIALAEDPNCNIGTVSDPLRDTIKGLSKLNETLIIPHQIAEYTRILSVP
ncbi:hypothetical protein K7432_015118 [Basidiobolus ranarum]|uniref:Fungal lipase-type domain-containing protein n=1 Tax=Basidiobolus ranarum TaxID=34480 RepID=A0ABR2VNI6_9FUNG